MYHNFIIYWKTKICQILNSVMNNVVNRFEKFLEKEIITLRRFQNCITLNFDFIKHTNICDLKNKKYRKIVTTRLFLNRFWVVIGSLLGRSCVVIGSFLRRYWVVLGSFLGRYWVVIASFFSYNVCQG